MGVAYGILGKDHGGSPWQKYVLYVVFLRNHYALCLQFKFKIFPGTFGSKGNVTA